MFSELVGGLVGWLQSLTGWLVGWLVGWVGGWFAGSLWFVGPWVGCLLAWVGGWAFEFWVASWRKVVLDLGFGFRAGFGCACGGVKHGQNNDASKGGVLSNSVFLGRRHSQPWLMSQYYLGRLGRPGLYDLMTAAYGTLAFGPGAKFLLFTRVCFGRRTTGNHLLFEGGSPYLKPWRCDLMTAP